MSKRIYVRTKDAFLFQKIYISLLSEDVVAVRVEDERKDYSPLLIDIDTAAEEVGGALTMSRHREADLQIPFTAKELFDAVSDEKSDGALLVLGERCVYLRGKEIKLTEVEYSLLSLLLQRRCFVPREELLKSVWGDGADGGVLNVYIHYLREKLEFLGEKIIIASRGQGYKIDEKYLTGGDKNA